LIIDLSEDEFSVNNIVDMLSSFALQVAKKNGSMYSLTKEFLSSYFELICFSFLFNCGLVFRFLWHFPKAKVYEEHYVVCAF
jgi:Na+/pantothenate symporter